MPVCVGGDELQSVRHPFFELCGESVICAVAKRSRSRNAADKGSRPQGIAIDFSVERSEVGTRVEIGLQELVRRMVPLIADFQSQVTLDFLLDGDIPFLNHRIQEVLGDAAKLKRRYRRRCENSSRVTA